MFWEAEVIGSSKEIIDICTTQISRKTKLQVKVLLITQLDWKHKQVNHKTLHNSAHYTSRLTSTT